MYKPFRLSSALIQSIVLMGLQSWIILFYFNYTTSTIIYNKFKSYLSLYTSDFVAHSPVVLLFMLSFYFSSKITFSVLLKAIEQSFPIQKAIFPGSQIFTSTLELRYGYWKPRKIGYLGICQINWKVNANIKLAALRIRFLFINALYKLCLKEMVLETVYLICV